MKKKQLQEFIIDNANVIKTEIYKIGPIIKGANRYRFKKNLSFSIPELKSASAINFFNIMYSLGFLKIFPSGYDYNNKSSSHEIYVFYPEEQNIYTIANGLEKNRYISHYSALHANQLILDQSGKIFLKRERKTTSLRKDLNQKDVDISFSLPMRASSLVYNITWDKKEYSIILIEGTGNQKLGINKIYINDFSYFYCTDIERTLIDIVMRPRYAGSLDNIVIAFNNVKDDIDLEYLATILNTLNPMYPYENNIAFFMYAANYPLKKIDLFLSKINLKKVNYKFYLDYQMISKKYNEDFNVYYPSDLLFIRE